MQWDFQEKEQNTNSNNKQSRRGLLLFFFQKHNQEKIKSNSFPFILNLKSEFKVIEK